MKKNKCNCPPNTPKKNICEIKSFKLLPFDYSKNPLDLNNFNYKAIPEIETKIKPKQAFNQKEFDQLTDIKKLNFILLNQ